MPIRWEEKIVSAAPVSAAVPALDNTERKPRRSRPGRFQELSAIQLVRYCLRSGEQAAWQEFVRRFQPVIASAVIKAVRHWIRPEPSQIDDLVQETYLKLFADDFRPLRKFTCQYENAIFGFLKVVATNVVKDHFRSSYCQKRGNGKLKDDLDYAGDELRLIDQSAKVIERRILISQIEDCLKTEAVDPLFSRNYLIFQLYYEFGLTAEAISRVPQIGLTAKGVENTLARLICEIRFKIVTRYCLGHYAKRQGPPHSHR